MEEDIKILEEYLEEARDENSFTDCEGLFEDKFFISLDKLLKRYKELEEKETEKFLKILEDNSKTTLVKEVMELRAKLQDYIPISVIQNTLDNIDRELEEKYSAEKISVFSGNTYMEKFKLLGSRQVLQELLEERNK